MRRDPSYLWDKLFDLDPSTNSDLWSYLSDIIQRLLYWPPKWNFALFVPKQYFVVLTLVFCFNMSELSVVILNFGCYWYCFKLYFTKFVTEFSSFHVRPFLHLNVRICFCVGNEWTKLQDYDVWSIKYWFAWQVNVVLKQRRVPNQISVRISAAII